MRKHGLFLFGAKNTASFMEVRGLTLKGEITMMKAIKNFMNKPITYGGLFQILDRMCKHWLGIVRMGVLSDEQTEQLG